MLVHMVFFEVCVRHSHAVIGCAYTSYIWTVLYISIVIQQDAAKLTTYRVKRTAVSPKKGKDVEFFAERGTSGHSN